MYTSGLTDLSGGVNGYISTCLPFVGVIALACLAIWGVPKAVQWLKMACGR